MLFLPVALFPSPAAALTPLPLLLPPPPAEAAAILAEALQQRIDTALPVGSDPTQYAQWQADQAAAGGARQEEVDPSQWETDAAVAA